MRCLYTLYVSLFATIAAAQQLPAPRFCLPAVNDNSAELATNSFVLQAVRDSAPAQSVRSFGLPVAGDWTSVFQAAEASNSKTILLPPGRYPVTTGFYEQASKTYVGPGQIVVGANSSGLGGTAMAPFRSFITVPLPDVTDDRHSAFSAQDWTKALPGGVGYTFIGRDATGTPNSTYTNFPQLAQTFRIFDNTAGFNTDPTNHAHGRSGIFMDVQRLYHGGQGDLVGQTNYYEVYSSRPGATHWLANPAVVSRNGGFGASSNGTGSYLNESEFIFRDNGLSVTAIDRVRNYYRSNDTQTVGQVWIHDRPQSSGDKPIDGFYVPQGRSRRGYDTTASEFGSEGAAIVLKSGQRLYLNATAIPDPIMGTQFGASDLGGAWVLYDATTETIRINPGSGKSVVIDNLPTSPSGLPSGALYLDANRSVKAAP